MDTLVRSMKRIISMKRKMGQNRKQNLGQCKVRSKRSCLVKTVALLLAVLLVTLSPWMAFVSRADVEEVTSKFGGKKYFGTVKIYVDGQFTGITMDCDIVVANALTDDGTNSVVPVGDFGHLFDLEHIGYDASASLYGNFGTPSIHLGDGISYDFTTNRGKASGLVVRDNGRQDFITLSHVGSETEWWYSEEKGKKELHVKYTGQPLLETDPVWFYIEGNDRPICLANRYRVNEKYKDEWISYQFHFDEKFYDSAKMIYFENETTVNRKAWWLSHSEYTFSDHTVWFYMHEGLTFSYEFVGYPAGTSGINQKEEQNAIESIGEWIGENIIDGIVEGDPDPEKAAEAVGAGIIGVGTAIVSGKSRKKVKKKKKEEEEQEEEEKRSTFRMNLYKDFGGYLKRGDAPKYIYARMVETKPDGMEVDRPDLSARIVISAGSGGLVVEDCGMSESYKAASVAVRENSEMDSESVRFFFAGEGGTYTKDVWFQIFGDPLIEFPDKDRLATYHSVNGLLGDGDTYEVPFIAKYFTECPTLVNAESRRTDIALSVQQLPDAGNHEYRFKVQIGNHTAAPAQGEGEVQRIAILVTAQSSSEKAEESFYLELYPEGISVKGAVDGSAVQKGRVRLDTRENKVRGSMDPMIKPVAIQFITAYKNEQGVVVIDEKAAVADMTLSGMDEFSTGVIERYDYVIEKEAERSVYLIKPRRTMPIDPRGGYNLCWNATSSPAGKYYDARIPVDLIGEELDRTPIAARQEELQRLSRLAQIMLLYDIPECAQLISIAKNKQAASEIKQIRVQIFTLAVEYHTKQAAAEISYANWMNRATYVCAFLDWAGQQAFSYVIKVSYGDVAEMILSPLKNLLVEQTAEYLHAKYWDMEFQVDVYNKLMECFETMAESFLVDALFGEMSADDITAAGKNLWKSATADLGKLNLSDIKGSLMKTFGAATMTDRAKKAAAFVAAFAALNFTKHYCIDDETKNDFGKSIVATLNDCTLTTIKQIFNKYVGKWMGDWLDKPTESKGTRGEMLKGFIGKYFKVEDVKARGMLVENRDAVIFGKKYGFGIQENSLDIVGTQYLEGTIDKLVDNTIGEISGWFWDSEFGGFVVNTTSQVYTITLGTLIDYLFEWIQGKMDLEGPMMKNRVKVPDYIPPADEESMEKAKRL